MMAVKVIEWQAFLRLRSRRCPLGAPTQLIKTACSTVPEFGITSEARFSIDWGRPRAGADWGTGIEFLSLLA